MLKGVFIFILVILAFVGIIVMIAINIILRFLKRMRGMVNSDFERQHEEERRSTSRHNSQYAFRNKGKTQHHGTAEPHRRHTSENETIIDNRRPDERNRKIISAEEGEYVEFTEEA